MIEGYCQDCRAFEPEVSKYNYSIGTEEYYTNTIIKCENRSMCAGIKRYLDKQHGHCEEAIENVEEKKESES